MDRLGAGGQPGGGPGGPPRRAAPGAGRIFSFGGPLRYHGGVKTSSPGPRRPARGRLPGALLCALLCAPGAARARGGPEPPRFEVMGDGRLQLKSVRNAHRFAGRYRSASGRYLPAAIRQINLVFGADGDRDGGRVSLRLVELLSRLRADLRGGTVVVSSGYRGPAYNQLIRDRGGTVALSSLHQYGMAADLRLTGVSSKRLWRWLRQKKLGGAGYYGGPWVHVDVGHPRSWTQGTANVRSGRSLNNKLIYLMPWYDRYLPGETLRLRFVRMTAFPIGVRPGFELQREGAAGSWLRVRGFRPRLGQRAPGRCPSFASIEQMARVRWRIPADLAPGRYRVQADFCERRWPEMVPRAASRPFTVMGAAGSPAPAPGS